MCVTKKAVNENQDIDWKGFNEVIFEIMPYREAVADRIETIKQLKLKSLRKYHL